MSSSGGGPGIWFFFFFSSRRRHTRCYRDWSSDVCSSDLDAELVSTRQWKADVVGGRQNGAASDELAIGVELLFASEPVASVINAMLFAIADIQREPHNASGISSNENKISDGYRGRALNRSGTVLIMENVVTQRVAVRCIVWLDLALNGHCYSNPDKA